MASRRRAHARGREVVGDRRCDRHLAAHPRRQVPGARRGGEHPRRRARPITTRCRASPTPTRRPPPLAPPKLLQRDRSVSEVAKTATYTRAYAKSNGFLTLLSDGERLTGAYALGPEAGEWLQQATLAIRARIPLDVLRDTIQPFPTFGDLPRRAEGAPRGDRTWTGAGQGRHGGGSLDDRRQGPGHDPGALRASNVGAAGGAARRRHRPRLGDLRRRRRPGRPRAASACAARRTSSRSDPPIRPVSDSSSTGLRAVTTSGSTSTRSATTTSP